MSQPVKASLSQIEEVFYRSYITTINIYVSGYITLFVMATLLGYMRVFLLTTMVIMALIS